MQILIAKYFIKVIFLQKNYITNLNIFTRTGNAEEENILDSNVGHMKEDGAHKLLYVRVLCIRSSTHMHIHNTKETAQTRI